VAAPPVVVHPASADGVQHMDWSTLQDTVATCVACGLCKSRKNTVFGVGDPQADWMIVGEAPGEHEDLSGEPFVGAAGQLLDNMLHAVGRSRTGQGAQGAYIANVIKCRPPANRNPQPDEVARCEPYLARQVALLKPRVIVAMGRFAVQSLLKSTEPIGRLRGRVHHYEGVPVIVSYHPAYLLRTPTDKGKAWADLCLAMDVLDNAPEGTAIRRRAAPGPISPREGQRPAKRWSVGAKVPFRWQTGSAPPRPSPASAALRRATRHH
jgi:DNA polymerase